VEADLGAGPAGGRRDLFVVKRRGMSGVSLCAPVGQVCKRFRKF
jgi:hypothetical protein